MESLSHFGWIAILALQQKRGFPLRFEMQPFYPNRPAAVKADQLKWLSYLDVTLGKGRSIQDALPKRGEGGGQPKSDQPGRGGGRPKWTSFLAIVVK